MSIKPDIRPSENEVRWTVRLSTYPMDAIYGASYVFLDRCYVYLDKPAPRQVEVVLRGREPLDAEALDALAGEFANQLLHQVLRARLAKRTGKVREMIIGRALFSAEGPESAFDDLDDLDDLDDEGLDDLDDEGLDDYLDDPLGIAVPWEEKYGGEEAATEDASADPEAAPQRAPKRSGDA